MVNKTTSNEEKKKKRDSRIFYFAARWSIPHTKHNRMYLYKWLKRKADRFVFQAECTERKVETDFEVVVKKNPHYQIFFHTKEKARPDSFYKELNEGEMKGMEIMRCSTAGKDALAEYCMKDETKVAGPWADHFIYRGQDLWPLRKMPHWQQEIKEYIDSTPNDRKMVWIYDRRGNNGKTKFVKYIGINYETPALGYASSIDALNLCMKFPHKRVYMWNLTRAKPANLSEFDLYSAMESIKDGCWINTKYETKCLYQMPSHVVVMANHPPKTEFQSADRWTILALRDSKLVPYDLEEKRLIALDIEREVAEARKKADQHAARLKRGQTILRGSARQLLGLPPRNT